MISKKLFIKGINQDDSHVLVDTNEYLNALNIRFATSENGKVGQLSNVEGNTIKNNSGAFTLPAGTNTTIGAWEDTPNRRVIFFNSNSNNNHGIYCYDADNSTVYTVLLSSQVVGGLGFSNLIHSVSMVGDLIYWTDGLNPQRRINVEAGIKLNHVGYSTSVAPYVLDQNTNTKMLSSVTTLIRNQPSYPLTAAKGAEAGYASNFIANEAFQFAYRFVYRDFEVSAFSPLSTLVNYHNANDVIAGYNRIDVTIPLTQKIPQDVMRVEVAVKFVIGGKYSIVKSFTSGFSTHNSGTALTFKFFNDSVGVGVDDASAYKQFDSIPITSNTLEIAKNRLFLGNNYDGYQAPSSTSLSTSTATSGGAVTGVWVELILGDPPSQITVYLLDITGIGDTWSGYYAPGTYPATTYTYNQSDFRGAGLAAVATYYGYQIQDIRGFSFPGVTATVTGSVPSPSNVAGTYVFKSNSSYKLGVVFYDESGRKCGVVASDVSKVVTPDRSYNNTAYTTDINWLLINSATPSVLQAEIPSWAYYYSVVMTKCLRTNFFMQMRAGDVQYATKAADGTYTFNTTYNETKYGVAVKIDGLSKYGMGYVYQEGDVLKLYGSDNTVRSLKLKDTYGDYAIVDMADLGTIVQYLFEIYTPYAESVNEFYYEKGVMYPVNNPGLSNRSYSTLSGSFKGDIILLDRTLAATNFIVESMSPNDLKWRNWNTNIGRSNIVSNAKPAYKKTSVYWSNVVVPGTQTNGLSTFDALDQTNLPIELNSIQRLTLVSKVAAEGTVMLAVGEQETASMYLGEAQIIDNTGNSFLASSTGVIGNVNVMRGSFGTINPESVVRYMGEVYWFDANKGSVVRYSVNGLFPISANKMSKYFRKIGQDIITGGYKMFGGIDPYHNEVLMFAPRRTVVPQNTVLSDIVLSSASYSYAGTESVNVSIQPGRVYIISLSAGVTATYKGEAITGAFVAYEDSSAIAITAAGAGNFTLSLVQRSFYDAYDGQGGVWSYQPGVDKWVTQYSFRPDWMIMVGNRLVTFKSGMPYVHNSATYNTFYGQAYDSAVAFVHNDAGNITKVYHGVSVEGDTPDLLHVRTEVPNVQSSDLRSTDFSNAEGVKYSSLYRDRLSPNVTGSADVKMYKGDNMRGEIGLFQGVFFNPSGKKICNFVNISFVPSRGHNIQNEQ
jgi:hypothetical protein